jgi:hypothetical protein
MTRSTGPRAAIAVALVVLVVVASVLVVAWVLPQVRTGRPGGTIPPGGGATLVNYTSSVDGTPLSYYEWLPTGYQPNESYPLAIYLHGQYMDGDELIDHDGGPEITAAAQADGYILISINTPRSTTGFFVNSVYTGPEEQDVLDAIAHEQQLRHVGALYLFGSSMGTVGTYSIAGHHIGMFAGIGVLNSCPDMFQAIQWRIVTDNVQSLEGVTSVFGALPNQTAYALGLSYYLSSARFFPQNYSGLKIYVTQGGDDQDCPNNPQIWPYQNANDTVLDSTCNTVPALYEPSGCTVPFANLSRADPSAWDWRFVYEPSGQHNLNEVNATDLFAFWSGLKGEGLFWGDYPFGGNLVSHPY